MRIRDVRETDWPSIAHLASDEVQEGDHAGGIDDQWIENRRSADREREDAVLESDGAIVGYCAIERASDEPDGAYRVFIVADWSDPLREGPEKLLSHVDSMLLEARAATAWMREVSGDRELLRFLADRGFTVSVPYVFADKELVNLTRDCSS